jgi:Flp pilus assembly protein TadD
MRKGGDDDEVKAGTGPSNPVTVAVLENLALVLSHEGGDHEVGHAAHYAEAEADLRLAVKLQPDDPGALGSLAWFLLTAGDAHARRPQEALEMARKAAAAAPQIADMQRTLGLAELRNGLLADAISTLRKASTLDSGSDPSDYFLLAITYKRQGKQAQAETNLNHGAELAHSVANTPEMRELWNEAAQAVQTIR